MTKHIEWTEERDEELKKHIASDLSASQIAIAMKLGSRNMVIGRAHRLGIRDGRFKMSPRPQVRPDIAISGRRRRPGRRKHPHPLMGHWTSFQTNHGPAVPFMDCVALLPQCKKLPIDKLTDTTCRWPLWASKRKPYDFKAMKFCGCEVEKGLPYCAEHYAIAYVEIGRVNMRGVPGA